MDRLGNGNSSHPDPILVVQTPAQVEVLHQIILKCKAGNIPSIRAFNKIILAGHSYGSFISNALNQKYPNDVDVTILTGFSNTFKTAMGASESFPTIHLLQANPS
jgi:pimeloyl-ACP methyl ester carboxylesterase